MDIVGEKRKNENEIDIEKDINEKKARLETSEAPNESQESLPKVENDFESEKESDEKKSSETSNGSQPPKQEIDPLKYTKAEGEEFTSEIYKVQVHNLPNYFGFAVSKISEFSVTL